MSDDSSDQELKALWQGDIPQEDPMSLEHIQAIAIRLDRRTRLAMILWPICAGVIAFSSGRLWLASPDVLVHVGIVLLGLGLLAAFVLLLSTIMLRRDPAEPGAPYLRRQLEQRLSFLGGRWMLAIAAMTPGLALLVARGAAHIPTWRLYSTLAILAISAAGSLIVVRRRRRKLRQELRELDAAMHR